MGIVAWLRQWFRASPPSVGTPAPVGSPDYSIPIRPDRTPDELVDVILEAIEIDSPLDALCFVLGVEFGLSGAHAALAYDRVVEGIERARAGAAARCPDRDTDPVAWISYQRQRSSTDPAFPPHDG